MKALITMLGGVALTAYMILFTAGVALSSKPYREFLAGPSADSASTQDATGQGADAPVLLAGADSRAQPRPPATAMIVLDAHHARAFLAVMFVYTPINIGFLAVLSGLLGGCASRITFAGLPAQVEAAGAAPPDAEHPHRTESPFASMFRSFLVYLAVMAGMYVIADNPFQDPTPQQYVRLASTVSLFAFIVGYDPTKFRDWIERVPKLGGAK